MINIVTSRLGENYEKVEIYFDNILIEIRYVLNGLYHREDGPACEEFYKDGSLRAITWYKYGKKHRLDGPACIVMHQGEGKIYSEEWLRDGKPYRPDGPYYQEWLRDGTLILEYNN